MKGHSLPLPSSLLAHTRDSLLSHFRNSPLLQNIKESLLLFLKSYFSIKHISLKLTSDLFLKGHPPRTDLRYGEEDSISPSTLICATIKSKLRIYTLHIHSDVHKKLALR